MPVKLGATDKPGVTPLLSGHSVTLQVHVPALRMPSDQG